MDTTKNRRLLITDDGYVLLAKSRDGVPHWCGYLGLCAGHTHALDAHEPGYEVHGGVTYWKRDVSPANGAEQLQMSTAGIVVSAWAGFDCSHHGDFVPHAPGVRPGLGVRVWELDDVWVEIEHMLTQAREGGAAKQTEKSQ